MWVRLASYQTLALDKIDKFLIIRKEVRKFLMIGRDVAKSGFFNIPLI